MKENKSSILPCSTSVEELVDFFETHDMGDYWEQMPEAHFDVNIDAPVKSRHSGEPRIGSGAGTGVQRTYNYLERLDSGFRRNDGKGYLSTFYECIKVTYPGK